MSRRSLDDGPLVGESGSVFNGENEHNSLDSLIDYLAPHVEMMPGDNEKRPHKWDRIRFDHVEKNLTSSYSLIRPYSRNGL
jgi:hypothetical protein